MYCDKCGTPITEGDKFCKKCGAEVKEKIENEDGIEKRWLEKNDQSRKKF